MDWASSQWKQELPPLAIQKINVLEEKIERLQKERQQKQLQCECLELALEKEKRKVENEKQQTTASQRELQSLADVCKDFEDKQQRLQNEIQNRDNRIASLEGLLSQAKKENCRLHQLENDLKELRDVREVTLLEREQKNESYNSGQNVKLQEKKVNLLSDSLSENSEISILSEKESSKYPFNENDLLSSLRKKISDQEKTIQELNLKLVSISDKESTKEPHHAYSKTPGRPRMDSVEASPALRNKSVWDSFASTPAKENKETILRHHNDSVSSGASDEKLMALQTRLKQLCQELDCQRHNFEASKVSMEQKFKEKENTLKEELKYQAQATADLDKELKDIRNKYQQEINQSTKKLDIITAQLKKTEETKAILEKEVKNLESKISSCTLSLKTKEEEVRDLQKLKNTADTTIQSLQAQVRDLERKCKNVQEQNSSLSETVKAVELQLDGSCNLAQEREADLTKVKKELENLSVSHKNLLNENQDLQNRIVAGQGKTEELLRNETILKEQVELMEKEQSQLTDRLDLETKKSQDLAFAVEEQKSQISLQKEELFLMESRFTKLKEEFTDTKLEFEAKIQQLEINLNTSLKEYADLENKLKEYSLAESSLKEKLEQIGNEKEEALSHLTAEKSSRLNLESSIVELQNQLKLLEEERTCKSLEFDELKKRIVNLTIEHEAQLQELEKKSSSELVIVQKELESISSNEKLLSNQLQVLEKEKEELCNNLAEESSKTMSLLADNEKQRINILSLQETLAAKTLDLENLKQVKETLAEELNEQLSIKSKKEKSLLEEMSSLKKEKDSLREELDSAKNDVQKLQANSAELELNIQTLNNELTQKSSELDKIQTEVLLSGKEYEEQLSIMSKKEKSLLEEMFSLIKDKVSLEEELDSAKNEVQKLQANSAELELNIQTLNNELTQKSSELDKIQNEVLLSGKEYEAKIQQLEINLNASQKEYADLENKLKELSLAESSLKEKLEQISNEKEEAVSHLTTEKSARLNLESSIIEFQNQIKLLEEERTCKSLEFDELKKRIVNLTIEHEAQLQELEKKSSLEIEAAQKQLESISSNEKLLSNQLQVLEKEKEELCNNLAEESSKTMSLLADNEKQRINILSLQETLSAKTLDCENLKQVKETLTEELNEQLSIMSKKEKSLLEEMSSLEKEKDSLREELDSAKNEVQKLQANSAELELNIQTLNNELTQKSSELDKIQNEVLLSGKEYEEQLSIMSKKEKSLLEEMSSLKKEKVSLEEELDSAKNEVQKLQANFAELELNIQTLNNELTQKSSELDKIQNEVLLSGKEYEAKIQQLEINLNASQKEYADLENKFKEYSFVETSLNEKLEQISNEKEEAVSHLTTEKSARLNLESSIVELQNQLKLLEEERTCKSLEFDELKKRIVNLTIEHEAQLQELEKKSSLEIEAAQKQLESISSNEKLLSNQLQVLEKEKEDFCNNLAKESSKTMSLLADNEKQRINILSLQETLAAKTLDLENLKQVKETLAEELNEQLSIMSKKEKSLLEEMSSLEKEKDSLREELDSAKNEVQKLQANSAELELNIQTLNNELTQKSSELDRIQNKVLSGKEYEEQLSIMSKKEKSLLEEMSSLKKEKVSLEEELDSAKNEVQKLQANSAELELNIQTLNSELTEKSSELDKMRNEVLLSAKEYEAKIQDLNTKLSSMEAECTISKNELQNCLLEHGYAEEKLKLMEENNNKLNEDLSSEISKSEHLQCSLDELKIRLSCLEEELSLKSTQLEEVNKKMAASEIEYEEKIQDLLGAFNSDQSKHSLLESQLQEYNLKETVLKDKIVELEKQVDALSLRLGDATEETQRLRMDYEEQASTVSALKKELADKCLEMDRLSAQIESLKKLYEVDVQDLQTRLIDAETETNSTKSQIQNYEENELSLMNKIDLLNAAKQKITSCLHEEIYKRQNLELIIEELKQFILSLECDLSRMSEECGNIDQKFLASQNIYEANIQKLENQLSAAQEKYSALETHLNNNLSYTNDIKENLKFVEEEKSQMSSILTAESNRVISLQEVNAKLQDEVVLLREQISCQSSELVDVKKVMENVNEHKNKIENLQKKLLESEAELVNFQVQIDNILKIESSSEMEVQKLETENQEIASCLKAEMQKTKELKKEVEHITAANMALQKEMDCKSLLLDDMAVEKAQYQAKIQQLEINLNTSQKEYADLENKLKELSLAESSLKEKLEQISNEKEEAVSHLTAEKSARLNLESSIVELQSQIKLLEEERTRKSMEFDELKKRLVNSKIEHEAKIQQLEINLNTSQKEYADLENKLKELSLAESSLKEKLEQISNEKEEAVSHLTAEKSARLNLESSIVELQSQIKLLEEERTRKSMEFDELKKRLVNSKIEHEAKVEQKNKLLCSSVPKKLHGSFSKELCLDEKVASFCISSLEENLSLRSFENDELSLENETLKEEFERAIQELQAEISDVKSENEHLRVKMKDVSLNAEVSQKRLELVEKAKQDLNRQLNFENKKIKILESGIQELKKIILTLQVLLISYNGNKKGLNSEMTGSKDCSEFKDKVTFNSIAAEKEFVSTTQAEIESFPTFYFPEFKSFSSLPEKEFSAALEKFSFYSLNRICDMENNLLSKLERCKFLCSYQLVDRMQLKDVWKLFLFLRRKLWQIQLLRKFIFCFCNILKSSLVAHILHSVNKVALVKVFPKSFGFALKDFLYLCNNAFNKILFSISQTFERNSSLVNRHSVFFSKYSDVHSNALHLPVIRQANFVLCQARFRRVRRDWKPERVSKQRLDSSFSARKQDVKKALNTLNAQEVPFFLNFTMSLMEKIGKEFCRSSNGFTDAITGHFSTSALQMKNYLSLLEPSSPIFQILSKYCIDILNLENVSVHDVCYWKHHCNILGMDKCDVQKMITLLEHTDKHRKGENGIENTGSGNKHAKEEATAQKNEKSLEHCLKIEKERQKLLNIAIEEIERDLGETFLQKEKFKNMALNVGKMLRCLQKYDAENFVFSNIQLDRGEISTETCFCENCMMDEDMSDSPPHDVLTLDHCLKCIDRLIRSGCRLEKEVCDLQKDESELKALSRRLKDKNSELEMNLDQCNRNLETAHNQMQDLTYSLQKEKEKYEYLSQSLNEKDTLNMQLQAENGILMKSIDECRTKLKVLEEVSSSSIDQEKLEFSLLCKDKEIASLKETFDENACLLNETKMKCQEYRNEIHLLNSRISKYEEEKMIDQHMISQNVSFDNSFVPDVLVKSSKTIINELQAKIDSLTKSNNSLNLTIENIEEELKNMYMEKKSVVEELEKLSEQIACFKQDISVSTQKYNDEKKINESLLLRLKEFEKLMLENEHIIKQLKTKNETLEKNAKIIKNVTKEHEQVVSKKNSDLKICHQNIAKLQKQIAELEKANSDLKVQTKVIKKQECLNRQLNEIISQKSELEKEIERLGLVETEKDQILERLSEVNLQRDNLNEQFLQLALDFKTQKNKNADLEIKCNELSISLKDVTNSNTSLEKELNENKNLISILNKQLEESSVELKNIKSRECELIKEVSSLQSKEKHLAEEIETLTKNLKYAKDNLKAEFNKTQLLTRENETLKMNVNAHANIGTELQKLRNTLNEAHNFIVNVLNTILCAVKSYPENTDFEELRRSLMASIVHCTQNSEKELQVDVFDQLNSFFGTLINNHKDDLVICRLISGIKDSVKSIATVDKPCQGAEASVVISPDTMCNMSVFESSFVTQTNHHSRDILADLKYIKAQTDEITFNFKKIISEKAEEIEKLKKELKRIPSASAKTESKPTELDKTSFKWKYELIKRQYSQLVEKYNAVIISSEQMEKTIKKLEEDNKNLDAEAEELSNEIKNMQAHYSSSDELLEALTELNTLRWKFKELENENKWLNKEIQEIQLQQTSAQKTSSSVDFDSLKHKLKELENENDRLKKRIQEFQLQQTSTEKPSPSCNQRQTQIPKFDKTYLKENNVNRFMKGS